MADFTMPALGADMETGTVVQWLVEPGARVKSGDVVAVVETHKGAIDVECFLDGVIDELVPVGQALPVGAVLARVDTPGDARAGPSQAAPLTQARVLPSREPPPTGTMREPTASPPVAAAIAGQPAAGGVPAQAAVPSRAPTPASTAPRPGGQRGRLSPAGRRRAAELGLDTEGLSGTGADGAVTLADVERAARETRSAPTAMPTGGPEPSRPALASGPRAFDAASMRRAIAAAMSRSKREIPHYYLGTTLDFAAATSWLESWNASHAPAERVLPACLLLKAAARALRSVPQLNGFYENGAFRAAAGIHVGWAISLRGGGLVAPAIHDADRKSVVQLMAAMRDLVQRARTGGLRSSELTDPTVTVTSLGERGAETVLGVIYPPQVAIIGFGRIATRPWVVGDAVQPRPVLALSLAADHRASDGHLGGELLAAIDAALQQPDQL